MIIINGFMHHDSAQQPVERVCIQFLDVAVLADQLHPLLGVVALLGLSVQQAASLGDAVSQHPLLLLGTLHHHGKVGIVDAAGHPVFVQL